MSASDGAPGEDLPIWRLDEVQSDRMKILALLLADPNPLHFDREACVRLGVSDREVNQGPSNMAMAMNMLLQTAPGSRLVRFRARLLGSVLAGDVVEATGRVMDRGIDGAEERWTCSFALRVVDRGEVLTGEAVLARDVSAAPA